MCRFLVPIALLAALTGCCSPRNSDGVCNGCRRPPLNCLGSAYDGGSSACYRPPGPFWCWYPGPCARCYDPYVDACDTSCRARCCGRRELARYCMQTRSRPSRDFGAGFTQAYVDVAEGGSGNTPAVPPERYWTRRGRTADGHCRADDWFAGYRAGAQLAAAEYDCEFNQVPTSFGSPQLNQASYQTGAQPVGVAYQQAARN